MKTFLLIFGSLSVLCGCARSDKPPERPKGVPTTAVWSGGMKGGDWFDCDYDPNRTWNNCTVYADVTGAVIESGRFQIRGSNRPATPEELKYAYHSLGEIYLKNEKILVRIDSPEK